MTGADFGSATGFRGGAGDVRLELLEAGREAFAGGAQGGEEAAELGLELVELGQHARGGLLDLA